MVLSFTVDGSPRQTAAGLLAATDELHKMARRESIGRRYRRHLRIVSRSPNTKFSWTMVGCLTHAVGVLVSRGVERWLPPIGSEKCTMSEQKRIGKQLDQLVAERTRDAALA
jgi:hypothetical protein